METIKCKNVYVHWPSGSTGSAAAAFMTLNGIESLLSHEHFKTENKTEMYSDVITATLPKTNKTQLSQPVNFTIQHKKVLSQPLPSSPPNMYLLLKDNTDSLDCLACWQYLYVWF